MRAPVTPARPAATDGALASGVVAPTPPSLWSRPSEPQRLRKPRFRRCRPHSIPCAGRSLRWAFPSTGSVGRSGRPRPSGLSDTNRRAGCCGQSPSRAQLCLRRSARRNDFHVRQAHAGVSVHKGRARLHPRVESRINLTGATRRPMFAEHPAALEQDTRGSVERPAQSRFVWASCRTSFPHSFIAGALFDG